MKDLAPKKNSLGLLGTVTSSTATQLQRWRACRRHAWCMQGNLRLHVGSWVWASALVSVGDVVEDGGACKLFKRLPFHGNLIGQV